MPHSVGRPVWRRSVRAMVIGIAALVSTGAAFSVKAHQNAATAPVAPSSVAPAMVVAPAYEPPVLPVAVVARYPHDSQAFTQGLLFHDGHLYESTGREGQSEIRRVDLRTGRVLARQAIPADQFGEGMALSGDTLISLTWQDGVAHRWDRRTLRPVTPAFRYTGEGWGLTTAPDGNLILSDGSDILRVMDSRSFAPLRQLPVRLRGRAVRQLNELEMVDGRILANVWMTPFILAIDPQSGTVTHILDLRPVVAEIAAAIGTTDRDAVLNGIAYDPATRRLFVTGKLWPTLFEIRLPGFAAPVPAQSETRQ